MAKSNTDDVIFNFTIIPFRTLNFDEKKEIIRKRPTPKLGLKTVIKKNGVVRTFHMDLYKKHNWICGSQYFQKLYCWPCLLFSKLKSNWNDFGKGYSDLNNIHTAIQRHASSETHINAFVEMKNFETSTYLIDYPLNRAHEIEIARHNEKVKNNRDVLKRFISSICLLGKQEISCWGDDESKVSFNRGHYVETIYTMSEFDEKLRNHLNNVTVFTGLCSDEVMNDLINCIGEMILEEVKLRIKEAPFVSLCLEQTSNYSQFSVVFRYTYNGECHESFVGFANISNDRSAASISQLVFNKLIEFECQQKLIAQTYGGAVVMNGHLNDVQAKIKKSIPEALHIHCYSHRLNLILSQELSCIKECKIFFSNLNGLISFFRYFSKRTNLFNTILKKRSQKTAPIRWNFSSRIVTTVFEHKDDLILFFETILDNTEEWDQNTIKEATSYLFILKDFDFNFLLKLFHTIYPHSEYCIDILQNKQWDISINILETEKFKNILISSRNNLFNTLWTTMQKEEHIPKKRKLYMNSTKEQSNEALYRQLFLEIIDCLILQIDIRFADIKCLQFLSLLNKSKYHEYRTAFPDQSLKSLHKGYQKYFDFVKLQSELNVLYKNDTLNSLDLVQLLRYLSQNDYWQILPQLTKLVSLVLTIPVSSASVERPFSALKCIKSYVRSNINQDRLFKLSLLSIEKKLLLKLKRKENFYDNVISKFSSKSRRMKFNFK